MLAIYKRELKSYFRSFIGFLFIAVTLFSWDCISAFIT